MEKENERLIFKNDEFELYYLFPSKGILGAEGSIKLRLIYLAPSTKASDEFYSNGKAIWVKDGIAKYTEGWLKVELKKAFPPILAERIESSLEEFGSILSTLEKQIGSLKEEIDPILKKQIEDKLWMIKYEPIGIGNVISDLTFIWKEMAETESKEQIGSKLKKLNSIFDEVQLKFKSVKEQFQDKLDAKWKKQQLQAQAEKEKLKAEKAKVKAEKAKLKEERIKAELKKEWIKNHRRGRMLRPIK